MTSEEYQKAKDWLMGRKVITTHALRTALGFSDLTAARVMHSLEKQGLIAADWDAYQGGYPVLVQNGGNHASTN